MNEDSKNDPYPEGYMEALENCKTLAANLLQRALTGEDIKRCWDCASWAGRCIRNKPNHIARSEACDLFLPKPRRREDDVV
jgi:hypothetical protein